MTIIYIMTFVLRFVSKRGAFCMETECVLYQNGRRFMAKWEAFRYKMALFLI